MKLTQPTPELAEAVQAEVDYETHLVGYKLHGMAGNAAIRLYTLEDVANFLHVDDREQLVEMGGGGTIGYVDLEVLSDWTREVVGDEELAEAIDDARRAEPDYKSQAEAVKAQIDRRLEQIEE